MFLHRTAGLFFPGQTDIRVDCNFRSAAQVSDPFAPTASTTLISGVSLLASDCCLGVRPQRRFA